ncbi:ankyrin repeat domain-containing protein [Legionella fallonii]|uniref:Uncharacterized protein n=1 Tax=Legionella fallonii LLAP-10 TaxID=1212491 RepID=A0A098G329_9GAMM|nr:ankyrin repeat domain-containing protein [Legionella fallonii]CEG56887.1 protein of unknown function [ankyrin repeat] [Legionella fallonii LLAP-10]
MKLKSEKINKIFITHVKQKHITKRMAKDLKSSDTYEPLGFEEIAHSQFVVAQTIISHPDYVVLQEGLTENLNKWHRISSEQIEIRRIFSDGFPKNYDDLSHLQKKILALKNATIILYYLGVIDNLYKTADENKQREYFYNAEADLGSYFVYKPREIDALHFAKEITQLTNNPKILLIFGAEHNFEKRIQLMHDKSIKFRKNIETFPHNQNASDERNARHYTEDDIDPYQNDILLSYAKGTFKGISIEGFEYLLDEAIEYGRDLTIVVDKQHQRNILHWSAYNGFVDVVKICLEKNRDLLLNSRSRNGSTPLHLAASQGHRDVVELLLEYGADTNLTDDTNKMASEVADENKFIKVVDLFTEKSHTSLNI